MASSLQILVDDDSPTIAYSPFSDTLSTPNLNAGWNPYYNGSGFASAPGESGNGTSYHATSLNGATFTISWYGTGIQLLGLAANISYVTILDGEHVQSPTVDSNENILASFQNLTNSVHSLTLQVVAPVSQPSPPTSVLFFDRALINTSPPSDTLSNVTFATRPLNDANIAFLGRWSFIEDSDGSSHVSTTRGDRVRTRFLGTSLQLFGTTSPQSGLYNIKVDNITTTLSARSSFTNDNSLLFFTSGLSMDQYHTLEVENVDGSLAVRSGGFLVGVPQDSTSLPIPPTLPSNSPAIEANNSVSFPPGAIAALALGGFLAFLIITGCIYYFFVYRPRRERRLGACSATGQLQEKPRDVGVVIDITQEANVTVDPRPYSGSGKWKLDLEQGRKSLRSLGIAFRRPGTTDDGEEKVDDQDLYRNASSITPPSSASGVGQTPENNGGNGKGKGKAIAIFKSTRASTRSRSSWTSSFAIDLSQFRSHSRSDTLSNIAGQSGVPHSPISLTTELAALANSNSNPNSPPAARPLPSTSSNRLPPPPLSLSNPTRTAPPPVPLQRTHTRGGSTIPLLQSADHHDSHNDDLGSPPNFPVNVIPRHPYASASRRTDSDSDYDPYHDQDQEFITTADIPLIDTTIAVSEFGQGNDVGGGDVRRPLPVPVPVSVFPPVPPVPALAPIPPSAEPMQPSQVQAQAASQETRRPVRKLPAIPQAQVARTPGPSTSTTSGFTTPSTSPPAMASAAATGRSLPLPPIISREPTPPRSNSPVLVASPSRFDGFSLDRPSTLPTNTPTQAQTLATPDSDVERDQDQSAQRRLFRLTPPSIHPQSTGGGSRSGSGSDSTTAEQQSFIDYDHSYSPTTTRSNTMSTHDSMSRAGSMRTYGTHGGSRDVNLLAYVHGRHRHGHSQSLSRSQSQGEGRPAFNARLSAVPPLPLPTSLTPVPTPSPSPPSHSTSQTVTPQPMLQRQVTGPSSPPVLPPVFARSPSPAPAPAPAPAPVLAPPAPPRLILPPFAPQNPPSPSPMTGEPLSSISTTDIDTLTGNRESSLYNMYFSPSQFPPVPFSHMQNQSYTQDQGRGRGQGRGPGQSSSRDSEIISPISSFQQPLSAAMASSDLQHTDFFEFHRDHERDLHPQRRMRTASGLSGYAYASGSGGGSGPTTPQRGSEREGEPRGQEQERRWGR